MPGPRKGKAGEWGVGGPGERRGGRRRRVQVNLAERKGTLCPHPARAPARPGGPPPPPPPPPPPGSEGSRRTCPFHCGSLCPAWRRSWIAGFLFIPYWAPLDSLYHPVSGGP
ncbi:unnamed protein product [Nyctereutes procyonoides]|uniref:(raccoon dog) hypothetical protein n=1 Tax=Nyctereutes procyonoides TaxID=34880 RepID=A0A811YKE1_NYCPR|nr:unnamed protein product [Nyctereutes procyonoides]